MRLMIAGGGGFRVPLIYRALSAGPFAGLVRELVLYDVDASRLAAIEAVLASLARQGPPGAGPQVRAVSSLAEALDGADMVFAAIRPGGTAGRIADERVALDLGLLGQETTGAGGISYALRSIPPMLRLARGNAEPLPRGVAAQLHEPRRHGHRGPGPGARAEGDRDLRLRRRPGAPCGAGRRSRAAGRQARRRRLLRPEPPRLAVPSGVRRPGCCSRSCWRTRRRWPSSKKAGCSRPRSWPSLGCLPNEYLFYYYDTARAVAGMRGADLTRGESIARQQAELYPRLAAAGPEAFALWEAARRSREEGYLAEARDRRANTGMRPTSPAAGTSGWPWRPCAPSPVAARRI